MLDTKLCIRILRDRPQNLRARFNAEDDALCISTIILSELLHGAEKSAKPVENRHEVERFAARLEVLAFDDKAANIRAVLETGLLIATNRKLIGPASAFLKVASNY